jgi:hypothetical protein
VLYKHDLFTADEGTPALTTNLVDLEKVEQRWRSTATTFGSLWSPRTVERLETIDPREVFRHEYFVHEAGHLVGFDVDAKVSSGYFRPGGRLAWRLVYVEEVRADLHALALATEVLQVEQAVDVFYGHVATRFGMMAPEDSGGKAPFGLVPYLLYVALAELGLVTVHGSRFVVCRERSADIASGMQACGAWATERLTGPELMSPSLEGRGLVGAAHVRRCLEHPMLLSSYCRVRGPVA